MKFNLLEGFRVNLKTFWAIYNWYSQTVVRKCEAGFWVIFLGRKPQTSNIAIKFLYRILQWTICLLKWMHTQLQGNVYTFLGYTPSSFFSCMQRVCVSYSSIKLHSHHVEPMWILQYKFRGTCSTCIFSTFCLCIFHVLPFCILPIFFPFSTHVWVLLWSWPVQ